MSDDPAARYDYYKVSYPLNADLTYRVVRYEDDPVMELWLGKGRGYSRGGNRLSDYSREGTTFEQISRNEAESA